MGFETLPVSESQERAGKKEEKKKLGAAGAVFIAGLAAHAAEGTAQELSEQPKADRSAFTAPQDGAPALRAEKAAFSYGEYGLKKRPQGESDDEKTTRLLREAESRNKTSLLTSAETTLALRVENAREAMGTKEIVQKCREEFSGVMQKITLEMGASAEPYVTLAGNMIVNSLAKRCDRALSAKITQAVLADMPTVEAQTLAFVHDPRNAENMRYQYTWGGKKGWKITIGVDPGLSGLSWGESIDSKLNLRAGVTARFAFGE